MRIRIGENCSTTIEIRTPHQYRGRVVRKEGVGEAAPSEAVAVAAHRRPELAIPILRRSNRLTVT